MLKPLPIWGLTHARATGRRAKKKISDPGATLHPCAKENAHLEERAPAPEEKPTVKSEADLYLDVPSVPMDADVLEWWALNEMKFPGLSVMARQYLVVPAISASAESFFSVAGRVFDDLRQRMRGDMMKMVMWARVNREKRLGRRLG